MKRVFFGLMTLAVVLLPFSAHAQTLEGRILLQVQGRGEAWYVHEGIRYYMKDGATAYEMLRRFGLGVSELDFQLLLGGDQELTERLLGKIILRVQSHGEAYYIHPETGSLHYLKDGQAAYDVMRLHSLGITNADLETITLGVIELPETTAQAVETEVIAEAVVEEELPKIVYQPIYIYVEAEEEPEEVVVEEELEPIPLAMWINASNSGLEAHDEVAYGKYMKENLDNAGKELNQSTTDYTFDVQPDLFQAGSNTDWVTNSLYNIWITMNIGSEDDIEGVECYKFGSDFWQGDLDPHDHTIGLNLAETMIAFSETATSADYANIGYSQSYKIGINCSHEDDQSSEVEDYLYLRLTTDY